MSNFHDTLKKLHEAATPGPWVCFPNNDPLKEWSVDSRASDERLIQHNERRRRGDPNGEAYEVIADSFVDGRDADFIVTLVNSVPALLRLLEALDPVLVYGDPLLDGLREARKALDEEV